MGVIKKIILTSVIGGLGLLLYTGVQFKTKREREFLDKVSLRGTVISENYQPGTNAWGQAFSKYSFMFETEHGKKLIQITEGRECNKETIDTFLSKGDIINLQTPRNELKSKVLTYNADYFLKIAEKQE